VRKPSLSLKGHVYVRNSEEEWFKFTDGGGRCGRKMLHGPTLLSVLHRCVPTTTSSYANYVADEKEMQVTWLNSFSGLLTGRNYLLDSSFV